MKTKINVIIFVFDGVIVDSGADIASAVNYTLRYYKRPELSQDEIISYVGKGAEQLIRACFKDCDEDTLVSALPFYKDYYLSNCIVETKLYTHVRETLEFFKDKKIALVTNKPEALTLRILEGLGVRDYFKMVVAPESVKRMKPDPEGVVKVLEYFNEQPGKAIMVGDSYTDIQAGRNAGTHTCGVTYGLGSTEELMNEKPDFVLDDMIKLTEVIE